MTMTKRERVLAALGGKPVDPVPLALWLHNFATENSADGLAAETLRLARTFDWDYLKPQSRAQCFAEMWGLRYQPSVEQAVRYTITHSPIGDADGLSRLAPADPRTGSLGEQLQALRTIRGALGADTPIIWTIFSPLMILPALLRGGQEQALALIRSEPAAIEHAFEAMTETLAAYARECLAAGADGVFYATNMATRDLISAEECRRFQRPSDLRVLAAVAPAPFNVLHVCGAAVHFGEFVDYPVTAFSWATVPGNPTLADAHRLTGRAVVGGLPAKQGIASMTPEALAERTRAALHEMDGRWLLLGPDCSINPDTPETLMHAVGAAARAPR
jgi:uroporphyrinogen decarboxylase